MRPLPAPTIAVALLALLFFPGVTHSAGKLDLPAQIETLVRPCLKDRSQIAVVVGVLTKDRCQVFGFGRFHPDRDGAPDGDTLFEIGSITKVFTGLLLADMAQRGEVRLDDPVQRYLPEDVKVPRRGERMITLLHLATHTSGLPRMPPEHGLLILLSPAADQDNPYVHYGAHNLYAMLGDYRLTRDIGARYEYSNLGMGLLGHALVRRAGVKTYEELVRERLCQPLGLGDTCVTLAQEQRRRLIGGHDAEGKRAPAWDFDVLAGCGALRSSTNDLLRFLAAELGLRKSTLRPALRLSQKVYHEDPAQKLRLGLGWHVLHQPGKVGTVHWHSGGTGGFHSFLALVVERGIGVVVLCNSTEPGEKVDEIGLRILPLLLD